MKRTPIHPSAAARIAAIADPTHVTADAVRAARAAHPTRMTHRDPRARLADLTGLPPALIARASDLQVEYWSELALRELISR
jgi:hypothetical protein